MSALRLLLITLIASASPGWAQTNRLLLPPRALPPDSPRLSDLLVDDAGKRIASKNAWFKKAATLRQSWQNFLRELPATKPALNTEVLSSEEVADGSRQHIRYQIEPGTFTEGYLLRPKTFTGKRPAIVVFHPTTALHARGVAGLDPSYPEDKQQGLQLVRRGYIVWCPRNYIYDQADGWEANAARVQQRHPAWKGMTRMVWDAIRAADFLESLDDVDAGRIGCLGHSLGAKQVLYAMAFDPRYRVGVASEGGLGLKFSNWDAPWYLGPEIRQPDFALEHHQLLALIAPRAFLLLAGDSADGDKSWPFIETVLPVYKLLNAPENVGWLNHHLGHNYPPLARETAERWLEQKL
jgi:hypothetical protein